MSRHDPCGQVGPTAAARGAVLPGVVVRIVRGP